MTLQSWALMRTQMKKKPAEPKKKLNGYAGSHLLPYEKVSFVDPTINRRHTTFLNQKQEDNTVVEAPEKVHVLEPEVYQAEAAKRKRTTFYNKKQGYTNFV